MAVFSAQHRDRCVDFDTILHEIRRVKIYVQIGSEMGQEKSRRGRPREYDEAEVLEAVLDVFWRKGFSAATLPDLSEAAGITRPSLYTALGDKLSMYLRSLEHFSGRLQAQLAASLDPARPLGDGLFEFYEASINVYLRGGEHPRGCLVVCTAAAEANGQPEIREALASMLATIDSAFRVRFEAAVDLLPLDGRPNAKQLAAIAGAILHSLALRARAGEDRASLTALARSATRMLSGALEGDKL